MNLIALSTASVAVLAAAGLVAWAAMLMRRATEDLRTFVGFEGTRFEDRA